MLGDCRWLSLEVKSLDSVAPFYREQLSMPLVEATARQYRFDAGGNSELRLRRPNSVPRGGLHTHYAFSCPADAYDAWWDHLAADFELQEVDFGSMRSLYLYDPAGSCVEIAGTDAPAAAGRDGGTTSADRTLSGIFEVVFEVADLPTAEQFYTDLGFEVVDRGDDRTRTRLTDGPLDIELWEPQLGLADARGGVHVDVGIEADAPAEAADSVTERATAREQLDDGAVRIRDPDGHYLTFVRPSG